MNDLIAFSSTGAGVFRDTDGVPVEWTLFSVGDTRYCQEGGDGLIRLTSDDLDAIVAHYEKKGEEIPVDSEHFLHYLAEKHGLEEREALALLPSGIAALGFGKLARLGDDLRIHVNWTPSGRAFLRDRIFKYFSPVIRGFQKGPLRVTSVAMTNTPAINHLDALCARAEKTTTRKDKDMSKLEKALAKLLGRDSVALAAEGDGGGLDDLAAGVEEKAAIIEQVAKLLNLDSGASLDEIIAALTAEVEKAKAADEKQAKLDELAAAAERSEHDRLVAKGRAERKIVDADMDYINSLDSKALSAYLEHAAPKFPAPLDNKPPERRDAVSLTSEDKAACRRLNIPEDKFLEAKRERMK